MTEFSDLKLPKLILDNISRIGWTELTRIQEEVIPKALEGDDILGGAPTGTGKSAAFLVPVLARLVNSRAALGATRFLILEPTRELALQVAKVAESLLEGTGYSVGTIIGGAGREQQREHSFSVIAATPGRLLEFLRKDWLDTSQIEWLVIDEADRMLDMGFRDDVSRITSELMNRGQTMLFSATLEGYGIRQFAAEVLDNPAEVRILAEGSKEKLPDNLQQRAYYTVSDEVKAKVLVKLLTTSPGRAIVFVKTRDRLTRVWTLLKRNGFSCATLQGEQNQTEREAAIRRYTDGECSVLIATDVASRGLDLPEVAYVYHYDMPSNAAVYVHRAGRTARAGASGVVISFVSAVEIELLCSIERYVGSEIEHRQIKNICAAFPHNAGKEKKASEKKRSRASIGGHGGFDKKKEEDKKKHRKIRLRDVKNKGKPDFAEKRRRRAGRAMLKEQI